MKEPLPFVSRETEILLHEYQKLIIKWNQIINLVSQHTITELWERHILDSWQLLRFIDNKNIKLIDLGSGAGLPGIILSIAGISDTTLIEANAKKCSFLEQASKISRNKVAILNCRCDNIQESCDILVCRAFAPLKDIFNYSRNIRVGDKFLLLKGKNYHQELEEAQKYWCFDYALYDSMTSKGGKILEINNVRENSSRS